MSINYINDGDSGLTIRTVLNEMVSFINSDVNYIGTGSFATTGSNILIGNQTITGSVDITGSVQFSSILTLTPQDPLPNGVATGSFAVSSSVPPRPYMWDGSSWYAL